VGIVGNPATRHSGAMYRHFPEERELKMKPRGYVLFEGPSLIDGSPIVVIGTMKTRNEKTGQMVQTWILRQDIAPTEALKTGQDYAICGNCPHRPVNQGSCYVTVFQAPGRIYSTYKAGRYSRNKSEFLQRIKQLKVRFGAYGDPAAAPVSLWRQIAENCAGYTGYTHQWEMPEFDSELLNYVMASADTEKQARQLQKMKARYFRVIAPGAKKLTREVECLSDSVGKSCADCLLCDGGNKGKNVYITVHGAKSARFNPEIIAMA
jgi:hypothetical protein